MKIIGTRVRSVLLIGATSALVGLATAEAAFAESDAAPADPKIERQDKAPATGPAAQAGGAVKPAESVKPTVTAKTEPAANPPVAVGAPDDDSLLGSYLAGRVARGLRDYDNAAKYFERALGRDPNSDILLEQTFVLELSRGDWTKSVELARDVVKRGERHRFARMVLGLQAVMGGKFDLAANEFSKSERRSPLGKMIGIIVEAWLDEARGDSRKALKTMRRLESMNWAKFYQDYHTAMIADQSGRTTLAGKIYQRMFEKDPRSLRMMEAFVRHYVASGQPNRALELIAKYRQRNGDHPLVLDLEQRVKAGEKLAFIANTPQDGLAELYYGIGDALTGDGGVDLGLVYLQAGLLLRPDLPLASLALAEAYEQTSHYEQANRIYSAISKDSPLWPNAAVRQAFNLNSLGKVDEAKALLDELLARYPKDITALEAQGNILRAHKRYKEAVGYYTRAIALLAGKPRVKTNWKYYYSRGVCYERLKDWPKAEKDLQQARERDPNQPLVLNYLGYSWVDQGLHLKEAMRFIRRAVELKPDDGYFVDSLGWAYYQLGSYKKAVEELERAVELKPDDPVINDHLGDAYWRVGRKLEAGFQWAQALSLDPEKDEIPKIEAKLKNGLAVANGGKVAVMEPGNVDKLKDAVGEAGGRVHTVRSGENLWTISKRYYGQGRYNELLLNANKNLIDSNGGGLKPGMKLIIPPIQRQ